MSPVIVLTRRQVAVLSLALDIAHGVALDRGNTNLAASIEEVVILLPENEKQVEVVFDRGRTIPP